MLVSVFSLIFACDGGLAPISSRSAVELERTRAAVAACPARGEDAGEAGDGAGDQEKIVELVEDPIALRQHRGGVLEPSFVDGESASWLSEIPWMYSSCVARA